MINYLIIIASGIFGLMCRWFLVPFLNAYAFYIPLGLLSINVLGSFTAGIVLGLMHINTLQSPLISQSIIIGFLGCLTTFSGYTLEVINHLITGNTGQAICIALLHPVIAIAATALGFFIVSKW
ncbi:MAG TPA: CrcB family protein [Candidatus Babeliales bacterium]|nr:CrcB family protein [Candidatus Babeliales bacterium]